jgi:hypothetical protein
MTNLTVIQTSPNPEQVAARARRHTSIAARISAMGQNRIGALQSIEPGTATTTASCVTK